MTMTPVAMMTMMMAGLEEVPAAAQVAALVARMATMVEQAGAPAEREQAAAPLQEAVTTEPEAMTMVVITIGTQAEATTGGNATMTTTGGRAQVRQQVTRSPFPPARDASTPGGARATARAREKSPGWISAVPNCNVWWTPALP